MAEILVELCRFGEPYLPGAAGSGSGRRSFARSAVDSGAFHLVQPLGGSIGDNEHGDDFG
jgi:hypothetical protein